MIQDSRHRAQEWASKVDSLEKIDRFEICRGKRVCSGHMVKPSHHWKAVNLQDGMAWKVEVGLHGSSKKNV